MPGRSNSDNDECERARRRANAALARSRAPESLAGLLKRDRDLNRARWAELRAGPVRGRVVVGVWLLSALAFGGLLLTALLIESESLALATLIVFVSLLIISALFSVVIGIARARSELRQRQRR